MDTILPPATVSILPPELLALVTQNNVAQWLTVAIAILSFVFAVYRAFIFMRSLSSHGSDLESQSAMAHCPRDANSNVAATLQGPQETDDGDAHGTSSRDGIHLQPRNDNDTSEETHEQFNAASTAIPQHDLEPIVDQEARNFLAQVPTTVLTPVQRDRLSVESTAIELTRFRS